MLGSTSNLNQPSAVTAAVVLLRTESGMVTWSVVSSTPTAPSSVVNAPVRP